MKRNLVWFALGVTTAIVVFVSLPFFIPARQMPDPVANLNAAQAEGVIRQLESLRSGDTNWLIEHLEAELDSRVDDLGNDLNSAHEITRHYINGAALHAKEYRSKFPRKTINPQVDEAVEKVFSKVK